MSPCRVPPRLGARHIRERVSTKPNNFRILRFESVVTVDWTHEMQSWNCARFVHILQHSLAGPGPAGEHSAHQGLAKACRQLMQRQVHITPLSLGSSGELVLWHGGVKNNICCPPLSKAEHLTPD